MENDLSLNSLPSRRGEGTASGCPDSEAENKKAEGRGVSHCVAARKSDNSVLDFVEGDAVDDGAAEGDFIGVFEVVTDSYSAGYGADF